MGGVCVGVFRSGQRLAPTASPFEGVGCEPKMPRRTAAFPAIVPNTVRDVAKDPHTRRRHARAAEGYLAARTSTEEEDGDEGEGDYSYSTSHGHSHHHEMMPPHEMPPSPYLSDIVKLCAEVTPSFVVAHTRTHTAHTRTHTHTHFQLNMVPFQISSVA